jgi:hypothetical protein
MWNDLLATVNVAASFCHAGPMLEIIRPILIFTGLLIVEAVPKLFFAANGEVPAKIVTACLVVAVLYGLDFVVRKGGTYFKPIRRIRHDPIVRYEGLWLQKVDIDERPYSVGRIQYLSDGHWSYRGIGYSKDHWKPAAEWETYSLNYDGALKRWHFAGDSSLLKLNVGAGHYDKEHRGYVSPILNLDLEEPDTIPATVVDLELKQENRVFKATLYRADSLYPVQLPSIGKLRRMSADEVKKLFIQKGLIPP